MNTKPVEEKPNIPQDKMPTLPKTEVLDKPRQPSSVFVRRIVLPMIPIFVIIFIIAAPLAWLVTPSPTTHSKSKPPSVTPPSESNTEVSDSAKTSVEEIDREKRILKASLPEQTKPSPPPPNVYWSVLSQRLLDLERQRVVIIGSLADRLPTDSPLPSSSSPSPPPSSPPAPSKSSAKETTTSKVTVSVEKVAPQVAPVVTEKETTVSESTAVPPPVTVTEITWATVGQEVLKLEKQRETAITALADQLKPVKQ